jgi:signal transduction histidine kinase
MIQRLKFRQRVLVSQVLLFLLFILITVPFVQSGIESIQDFSLNSRITEIIKNLKTSSSVSQMIDKIKDTRGDIFYKISLYNSDAIRIATTEVDNIPKDDDYFTAAQAQVLQAIRYKQTRFLSNATILKKQYVTVAEPFVYRGKIFVLHVVYASEPVKRFSETFNLWFVAVCFVALSIFSGFTWIIFGRLHGPIYKIINAIKSYQVGEKKSLPEVLSIQDFSGDEDFEQLANTLLTLYQQVQAQMKDITSARDEREAILESLGEGVLALTCDTRIVYANFTAAKMLGTSKRLLTDRLLADCITEKNAALLNRCKDLIFSSLYHSSVATDSIFLEPPSKIYYDLIAVPKADGSGAIIVIQDKTSQHKVLEMGKEFVANASHELRTPITIIKGFAETLQDMKDMPHEMYSSIIEKIVRNCQRMEGLIKSLLTMADVEHLYISPNQTTDLVTLVENCMEIVRAVYVDADICFHRSKEHVLAIADANFLELAVINLLTNAAKYSKGAAKIDIDLSIVSNEAKLIISDRGIGIPESDLEHIFERFYTVDKAHSRKLGGAGLGLSLVKTIIEKHEGRITVASTLGVGTIFTLFLPLSRLDES